MDTRQKILDVTEELCMEMLPQKITLDTVAGKACVGKGTIYIHFSSKDDLFEKLALTLIEKLRTQMMDAGLSSSGSSMNRLTSLGRAFNSFMQQHPMIVAIAVYLKNKPPWLESNEGDGGFFQLETVFVSMIESLVKLGVKEGLFRTDINTKTLAFFVLSVFRASRPMMQHRQGISDDEIRALILNGAGIPRST